MSKDRVKTILTALDTLQRTIPHLTDDERQELSTHLGTIAGAFEASAPEDVKVPFVKEISLGLAGARRLWTRLTRSTDRREL